MAFPLSVAAYTVMGPWFVRVPLIRQFTKPSPAQLRPRLLSWTQVRLVPLPAAIPSSVSLLSHFWLIHLVYLHLSLAPDPWNGSSKGYLHLLYQPYVGRCQATRVQSHQRQSTSAVAIATAKCRLLIIIYRSNCSHLSFEAAVLPINPNIYTDQWEPVVIYHYITLTGGYTTMQPTLLTSWLQLLSYNMYNIQGVDNHSWGLYCRRCYCICVCWSFQSDIPLFTFTWPAKHSPNQGWESTYRLHLYPLGGVFYSP